MITNKTTTPMIIMISPPREDGKKIMKNMRTAEEIQDREKRI